MSKLDEQTNEMTMAKDLVAMSREGTCAFTLPAILATCERLIKRIEELEAEVAEANAHVNIHAALIDAQKIYSDGLRNRILQLEAESKENLHVTLDALIERIEELEAELKPLRELKQMVLDHNGRISKMEIDPYSKDSERVRWDIVAKARECKAL